MSRQYNIRPNIRAKQWLARYVKRYDLDQSKAVVYEHVSGWTKLVMNGRTVVWEKFGQVDLNDFIDIVSREKSHLKRD